MKANDENTINHKYKNYICRKCYKNMLSCNCNGEKHFVPYELHDIYKTLEKKGYHIKSCNISPKLEIIFEYTYFEVNGLYGLTDQFYYDFYKKAILSEHSICKEDIQELLDWCKALPKYQPIKYDRALVMGDYNHTKINKEFGENLVMFQLMRYRGWDVENVDYVGADLIAIDNRTKQRYAIQVKLRHFVKDSVTNSDFTFDSEMKLKDFVAAMSTDKHQMIPIVAYVNINPDQSINTILINLYDLAELRMDVDEKEISYYKKGGYGCNTWKYLNRLLAHPKITHYRYIPDFINRSLDRDIPSEDEVYKKYKTSDLKRKKKVTKIVEDEEEEKDLFIKHDKEQKGTFGEWYYMLKCLASGRHPFLVQSEGIDILVLDEGKKDGKLSAVSVKTFSKKEFDEKQHTGYTFEIKNEEHMREFCDKWDIPEENRLVALQFLIYRDKREDDKIVCDKTGNPVKEYYMMYCFEMTLDYFTKKADYNHQREWSEEINQYLTLAVAKDTGEKNGYRINWNGENLQKLMDDKNITFSMVSFDEPLLYDDLQKRMGEYKKSKCS